MASLGWPDAPESLAGSNRYGWPDAIGISGRITPECARHHWPGLKAVIMVEYKRETRDHAKTVRQFYIASVVGGAEDMSKYTRSHWQIENCVHWVMDVTFRQDECRIRTGNAAANFATIKHAAMNLLRRAPEKISLPQKRHFAAWDDDYMEKIIRQ